ncbi:MAG: hypothetical protein IPN90_03105 [Elusimicrobia bacterium]|nr:hypothetical protein [Elusimicrobiota bacterium]
MRNSTRPSTLGGAVLLVFSLATIAMAREPVDPREEYRRESFASAEFRSFRDVHYRDTRVADAQTGHVGVDAHGQRVRMEENLTHPDPRALDYKLYNYRDGRIDTYAVIKYFDQPLPSDLWGLPRPYLWDVFVVGLDGKVRTYTGPPPSEKPDVTTDFVVATGETVHFAEYNDRFFESEGKKYQEYLQFRGLYNGGAVAGGTLQRYAIGNFFFVIGEDGGRISSSYTLDRQSDNLLSGDLGLIIKAWSGQPGDPAPILSSEDNGPLGNGLNFARRTRLEFQNPAHDWIEWTYTSLSDDGKRNTPLGEGLFNGWMTSSIWEGRSIDLLSPVPIPNYGFNFTQPNPWD